MHITKMAIKGFKSYGDVTTVDQLSRGHNVVVGRNGSGKSNFFSAIRFVLNDGYSRLGQEERQSLLHGKETEGFVELVFDNGDRRFPTAHVETVLRRTLSKTGDEYHLDGKLVTKSEVINLLQSAGFSPSNPYYIIPQGRLGALTNAKDADRLEILKEVAGTKVYEDHREESMKMMEEARQHQAQIQHLLQEIEKTIRTMERKKEEHSKYQLMDRERRTIQYYLLGEEYREIEAEIGEHEQVEVDRANVDQLERKVGKVQEKIKELEGEVEFGREEYRVDAEEHNKLVELDFQLRALYEEADQKCRRWDIAAVQNELNHLTKTLEQETNVLNQLDNELDQIVGKENRLRIEMCEIDALIEVGNELKNHKTQDKQKQWIGRYVREIQNEMERNQKLIQELNAQLSLAEQELQEDFQKIRTNRSQMKSVRQRLDEMESSLHGAKCRRDEMMEKRRELWKQESKNKQIVDRLEDKLAKEERKLYGFLDPSVCEGLETVKRLGRQLGLEGIHGPVYELFESDKMYNVVLETVMGKQLFNLVVEDEAVASQLVDLLIREKAGRITFMPLKQLDPKTSVFIETEQCIPLIKLIRFDKIYNGVFQQLLGKAALVPRLDIDIHGHDLKLVTLDGDVMDKGGVLTGGFLDSRQSKLEAARMVQGIRKQLEAVEQEGQTTTQMLGEIDQELAKTNGLITIMEMETKSLGSELVHLEMFPAGSDSVYLPHIENTRARIHELEQDMQQQRARIESVQNLVEKGGVEDAAQQKTRSLNLQNSLLQVTDAKIKIETERATVRNRIENCQDQRKKELTRRLEIEIPRDMNKRTLLERKIQQAEQSKKKIRERIDGYNQRLDRALQDLKQRTQHKEELENELFKTREENERIQLHVHDRNNKRFLLVQKRDEIEAKMKQLGMVSSDIELESMNSRDRLELIQRVIQLNSICKELEKTVEKHVVDQLCVLENQRDHLMKRKRELEQSQTSILNFVETLDLQKDEVVAKTFDGTAQHFSEIFRQLVPLGHGRLETVFDMTEDKENRLGTCGYRSIQGISIKTSFSTRDPEKLVPIQQLSGGQKSLVSLVFIFAIQRIDPAPFYLFDEIDANLDAAHRAAVSHLICELKPKAQFITTTFRPEMLGHADQFYKVTLSSQSSVIDKTSRDMAEAFVQIETV